MSSKESKFGERESLNIKKGTKFKTQYMLFKKKGYFLNSFFFI